MHTRIEVGVKQCDQIGLSLNSLATIIVTKYLASLYTILKNIILILSKN